VSMNDFQQTVRYPDALRGTDTEGRVYVRFIVNQFGEVENPEIIQGLHELADKEALRAVQEIDFKPGMMDGAPVRVRYEMPVFFRDR
jgi:periplasmic protein TonB